MVATNMKQLQSMLNKQLNKAMNVANEKMLADMYEETGKFYAGGEPQVYERTGALGDTPRTTAVSSSFNSASFEAYLDTNYDYTTGKNPTMLDVLNLANSGITASSVGTLAPTVGSQGFWDRAKEKMEKDLYSTFRQFFR